VFLQEMRRDCNSPGVAPWRWNVPFFDSAIVQGLIENGHSACAES
jgi:hypothetical protein